MARFAYVPLYKNPLFEFQWEKALHLCFCSNKPSFHPCSFISYVQRLSLCSIGYVWTHLHIFFLAQTRQWLEWNGHHNRMKTGSWHQNRMQVHISIKALQALHWAENICRCCPRKHELAVALCFLQISWSQQIIYATTRSQVTISLTAYLNYT